MEKLIFGLVVATCAFVADEALAKEPVTIPTTAADVLKQCGN
jgi:hypothetical protein